MGIHHWAASEDGAVRNCTARAHLSHWQLCHTPPVSMLTGCPSGDSCPTMGGWGGCDEFACAQQWLREP